MNAIPTDEGIHALLITKDELINASLDVTYEALLAELGPDAILPDGTNMKMKFEAWPGGRWFRDLGDNKGHLWGHVQVIKPPTLIEIAGPLFMSYPGLNHVQYRLTADGSSTRLQFTHRGMGMIPADHREGVKDGWTQWMARIKKHAEK